MTNFAISDGSTIINVIVCESIEQAKSIVDGEVIATDGAPWIGWTLENGEWRSPKPYPSWIWEDGNWAAPVEKPENPGYTYQWDEDNQTWIEEEVAPPYPSWHKNENGVWLPPVDYPLDGKTYFWDEDNQTWIEYIQP